MIFAVIKVLLTMFFVLILPGLFFLLAVFGWKNHKMTFFEKAVLTPPLSFIIVDLIVLLLSRMNIPIRGPVLLGAVVMFCLICYAIFQFRFQRRQTKKDAGPDEKEPSLFSFSTWQTLFILISIFLAIFIRTAYLTDTIVPSSTDLGHHMYWSQTIIDSGNLPSYGMPDFIIGEHMIFAVVNLLSGAGLMTAMPALVLLFANVAGIFTMAILAGRMFQKREIVAAVIFTTGLLYAISAPQGKYVSGGVIGNVIGDMLIPVCLYFLYRALREKNSVFAGFFVFSFMGLLYTHHLSSFILIYSLAAIILFYVIANIDKALSVIFSWIKVFLKPFPLAMIVLAAVFFLFIFTPSYFNPSALDQATGTPVKTTRIGLNSDQIEANVGSARLILGLVGFLLIAATMKRKEYWFTFSLAWALALFFMSWKPGWLYINVPSDRIGNYLFLPFSLLAAYGLVYFIGTFQRTATKFFSAVLLFILLFFVITNGLSDSAEAFKIKNQFQEVVQTFHSAEYLAGAVDVQKDVVLKDHVNVYGDSWYKLFFMKDYRYPLSRGNLSRYVDPTNPRETCTRDMISEPESEQSKACYLETGVNYVALNAQLEGSSFEKLPDFSKVYGSNYISVFRKDAK